MPQYADGSGVASTLLFGTGYRSEMKQKFWEDLIAYLLTFETVTKLGLCVTRRDMPWTPDLTHLHTLLGTTITVLSLIITLHKSPQHPLRHFRPSVFSITVPYQRLLTV
jgi:hypothetical protein